MDIALLSANANQLRLSLDLSPPFRYSIIFMSLLWIRIRGQCQPAAPFSRSQPPIQVFNHIYVTVVDPDPVGSVGIILPDEDPCPDAADPDRIYFFDIKICISLGKSVTPVQFWCCFDKVTVPMSTQKNKNALKVLLKSYYVH
jgi:hypothetical protein